MANSNDRYVTHFTIFREGESTDGIEIVGPENISHNDLKRLSESFRSRGYEVRLNGTPASDASIEDICASLRAEGISVFIDGDPATDDTPITNGSSVVAVGEVKGAHLQ